jgi:hypothetical protein
VGELGIASPTGREKICHSPKGRNVDPSSALAIQLPPGALYHGMKRIVILVPVQRNDVNLYGTVQLQRRRMIISVSLISFTGPIGTQSGSPTDE